MRSLAVKPGHDGSIAYIEDGTLIFSHEAEKDSFARHADLSAQLICDALLRVRGAADVLAIGGWHKLLPGLLGEIGAGYRGLLPGELVDAQLFGHRLKLYSSSHERSHIIGGVAMSPFPSDTSMAVLVWEGVIGSFYHWRGADEDIDCHDVLDQPGARYSALFALADPSFPDSGRFPPTEYAGKLMALAGWADDTSPTADSREVVESLLHIRSLYPFHKGLYRRSGLYSSGVATPEVCRAARYLTDRLFDIYFEAAQAIFRAGLPLVIVGGCGLNCDWNARWNASGLFSDVFVPPCADDSGSAIGTAIDAAMQLGADCQIDWSVYSGPNWTHDADPATCGWVERKLDYESLCDVLNRGSVVAWVQGRCEIGPRALGNRSLLASAVDPLSRARLNRIKERESYRPIAPVCLVEELGRCFDNTDPDPYMLFFRHVRQPSALPSVTHADGSARVQSVTAELNPRLHALLVANQKHQGVGVLCNTSLNFKGCGFINRTSEMLHYCDLVGIREAVIEGRWYRTKGRARTALGKADDFERPLKQDVCLDTRAE